MRKVKGIPYFEYEIKARQKMSTEDLNILDNQYELIRRVKADCEMGKASVKQVKDMFRIVDLVEAKFKEYCKECFDLSKESVK